jgi:hypothetical protein
MHETDSCGFHIKHDLCVLSFSIDLFYSSLYITNSKPYIGVQVL